MIVIPTKQSTKHSMPLLSEIRHQFAARKKGKACGESTLVPELFRHFPKLLSEHYFPLYFKTYARLMPPLQWKGGMMQELFKNKGSPSIPSGYRDVLLADDDGKAIMKYIRQQVMPNIAEIIGDTQYGSGFGGGETAFAHLGAQLFVDYAKHNRSSSALLFIDLSQAFASLVRRVCMADPTSDEGWLSALRASGYQDSEVKSIYDAVASISWLCDSHTEQDDSSFSSSSSSSPNATSLFPLCLASSFYNNFWFSTQGLVNVVRTQRGSGAGTPLADIIFGLAMARVIYVLREEVSENGYQASLGKGDKEVVFKDLSYHDDLVIPVVDQAERLVDKVAAVASLAAAAVNSVIWGKNQLRANL